MKRKFFRYFGGFIKRQERWLNRMAAKGYRLVGTSQVFYVFKPCEPNEYEYRVEFAAGKTHWDREEYRQFLHSLGYKTFWKNINLYLSLGKVRVRPWAEGIGKLAVSPGSYGKELLIVEKKQDGKPFELRTSLADQIKYYRTLRNAWIFTGTPGLVLILAVAAGWLPKSVITIVGGVCLALLRIIPGINYSIALKTSLQEQHIHE